MRFASRYLVVRVIKSGGMGAVYEVLDERTASPRALKIMHPDLVGDEELRARFEQEARVTGGIESEHVAKTYDAGVDAATGTPFIIMELLRGEELGSLLKQKGAIPVEDALLYLTQAGMALDKMHAAGIIHRDLKPENLYITRRDDGSGSLKILDFGVAKVLSNGSSKTTKALGTPLYMPLEQIQGNKDVGPAADRYALGHIAYTMLTGEPYWREESRDIGLVALCMKVASGLVEDASVRARRRCQTQLPTTFDGWFQRATATAPTARYTTSAEMVRELRSALQGRPVFQPETPRGDRVNTPLTLTALERGDVVRAGERREMPSISAGAGAPARPRTLLAVLVPLALLGGGAAAYFVAAPGKRTVESPAADTQAAIAPTASAESTGAAKPGATNEVPSVSPAPAASASADAAGSSASVAASSSVAANSSAAAATSQPVAVPHPGGPKPRPTATPTGTGKWSIY
jgi:serine/threonine-protein kinase